MTTTDDSDDCSIVEDKDYLDRETSSDVNPGRVVSISGMAFLLLRYM